MWNRWSLMGLVAAVALVGATVPARSQNPGAAPAAGNAAPVGPVVVENCSVKLINEVTLSVERPGILGVINVTEGDNVDEGDLLAKVKDEVPQATLEIAIKEASSDIDIRYATKAAEVAQVEFEKAEEANRRKSGTVPEVEVRRAQLAAEKSKLEIEKAEHVHDVNVLKRNEAEEQLRTCHLKAPFRGFVSKVHLTKGAPVRQGDPVIDLVDRSKVKVEGHVSLVDALRLKAGMPVKIDIKIKDETINPGQLTRLGSDRRVLYEGVDGVLKFVDVKATAGDHKVRIWAEIPNIDDKLIGGLNASMTISLPENGPAKK